MTTSKLFRDSPAKGTKPTCVLDQNVVNAKTVGDLQDMSLSFFATLCGKNRGAFVIDPPDGATWGCTQFPPNFPELAGVNNTETASFGGATNSTGSSEIFLKDANAIKEKFQDGNATAEDTVKYLDFFIKSVYYSTPNVDQDVYACDAGGLATLQCDPVNTIHTIRSATLAGVFTPATWATGGKPLTLDEAKGFYTDQDFEDMYKVGLNAVQIPFPLSAFDESKPKTAELELLSNLIEMAENASLQTILVLEGKDNDGAVAAAANYAASHGSAVFAVIVPSKQSVGAARAAQVALKLMVPVNEGDLKSMTFPDDNVFAALGLDHTSNVGDIASSSSKEDRMKMFYHESISCIGRSPLEFSECYRRVPVYVWKGFDAAIDNCWKPKDDETFVDYGQCGRLNETVDSPWWHRHRASFVARQVFSYEHGLGWSFSAWKLYGDDDSSDDSLLDEPAKLLALKNVAAAGLLPSLVNETKGTTPANDACLNPPVSDFVLGDATLAPTPPPPPDCGNGWWNYDLNDCEYWVPPTPAAVSNVTCNETTTTLSSAAAAATAGGTSTKDMGLAAGGGALVMLLVVAIVQTLMKRQKRAGYSPIPTTDGRTNGHVV